MPTCTKYGCNRSIDNGGSFPYCEQCKEIMRIRTYREDRKLEDKNGN